MWAGRREREIEGGREQAGWRTGGARGRTDVCVCAQKGEGDRRGEGGLGGAGGKRTRGQGG